MKIADMVHSDYSIALVTYSVKVDKRNKVLYALSNDSGIIAEVKSNRSKDHGFSVILYSDHSLEGKIPGLIPISIKDGIYEIGIKHNFLDLVRDAANREHIMRMRYFVKPSDGNIDVTVFLPAGSLYEYYSILFEVARKNRMSFVLKNLMPYSPDIWELI
jgi:hypothetical protein